MKEKMMNDLRMETDPVSETSCLFFFLVIIKIWTMDKVRNPSNSMNDYVYVKIIGNVVL
jgi:hypothetical protein